MTGRLARGWLPLLAFALLSAAVDVYAGNRLQALSPLAVAAISFTLTAAFFLGGEGLRRRGPSPLRTRAGDVAVLNVSTAATWLSLLYALKLLEPAVVNVVGLALGPLLTVLLAPLLRRGGSILRAEVAVSAGICACIVLLAWESIAGRSGIGHPAAGQVDLGLALTLVCGVASTVNVIYSKRLSDAGHRPEEVLAVRFFLIIAVSWALLAAGGPARIAEALLPGAVIAVIGVALPMYLLQLGIRYTEPITASLLTTLSPPFAFLLQLPDRRLHPSALTLIGIAGITALVAVGVLARGRLEGEHPVRREIEEGIVS